MRGKERRNHGTNVCGGITPAYAGKSGCCHHLVIFVEDHPRVCGEKEQREKSSLCQKGSPPRMRGKVRAKLAFARYSGITPAYAGKRRSQIQLVTIGEDHPRVCGEKRLIVFVFRAVTGSPPRMRGKVVGVSCSTYFCGITPAYAGKSLFRYSFGSSFRDHPRVCGEKGWG